MDILGYFKECDILIRSLYEIVVKLAYLELNPKEHYERLKLYSYYEEKKFIEQLSKEFNADINSVSGIDEINIMTEKYKNKKYSGNNTYWNGMNIKDTAQKVDEDWDKKRMVFHW